MPKKGYHMLEQRAVEEQPRIMPYPPPPYIEGNVAACSESHAGRVSSSRGGWVGFSLLKDTSAGSFSDYPYFYNTVCDDVPWHAFLDISARDLPILMKQGLHWSEEDIVAEAGYFDVEEHQIHPFPRSLGFTRRRCYKLRDHSEEKQWEGNLMVFARDIQTLTSFKPSKLSINNIRFASAGNANDQIVYQFDRRSCGENFNAIYDNMPLEGWWPWP